MINNHNGKMIMIQMKIFTHKNKNMNIQVPKIIKLKSIKMMASITRSSNQPQTSIKRKYKRLNHSISHKSNFKISKKISIKNMKT